MLRWLAHLAAILEEPGLYFYPDLDVQRFSSFFLLFAVRERERERERQRDRDRDKETEREIKRVFFIYKHMVYIYENFLNAFFYERFFKF